MKDAVEPALGPATTGEADFTFCLACDARGRVLSILGARARELMLEADGVEHGGRRERVRAVHVCEGRGVEEGR